MLPELTEFVPAIRMGIVRKVLKTVQDAFFHFFSMLLNSAYASNLKLGGNLEFSWYSCNILRYCSNRCIVWFFIAANCPAQANTKFPVQLYVKIQILFEPPFGICKWANHLSFLAMMYLTSLRVCPGLLALVDDLFLCVLVYISHNRLQTIWWWNGDCLRCHWWTPGIK